MTIFEMDAMDGGNDDENAPSTAAIDDEKLISDERLNELSSEEYKSCIVPFVSQRGKHTSKDHPPDRYKMSSGLLRPHRILQPQDRGRQPRWTELELTGGIRALPRELFTDFKHLTALHLSHNELKTLPSEISCLSNLVLLNVSHNKLRSLPQSLGDMIGLCHLYLDHNLIRQLPYELGKLHRLVTLGLRGNNLVGEIAKLAQEPASTSKVIQYLLDHLAINCTAPAPRQWCALKQLPRDKPYAQFTVLCYNVLSDKYATPTLYSYCPSWALHWEYRKTAILKELHTYNADIIALQEVETEQYTKLFLPDLESRGYAGIFSPKSRAKTMNEEERKHVDGCAIFWKVDKFELEQEHLIEFTTLAMSKAEGSEHMLNRVMTRDNIGLCAVLKVKQSIYTENVASLRHDDNVINTPLVVCTAHIHWDPEYCDVKLVQTMMLIHELQAMLKKVAHQFAYDSPVDVPLLICGDLNSLPTSGVYQYLAHGNIQSDHTDFKEFRVSEIGRQVLAKMSSSGERGLEQDDMYTHQLVLESAYDEKLMPYTNYTLDFKGIIDYVFASPPLQRISVLMPIDPQWFVQNKVQGCPHPHVPSDHIPLLITYVIIPKKYVASKNVAAFLGVQQQYNQQPQRQSYFQNRTARTMNNTAASSQYGYLNSASFTTGGFGGFGGGPR